MKTAVSEKGQVTIPKAVRDQLGLLPHTEVEFVVEGDGVRLVKARAQRGEGRGSFAVRLLKEGGPLTLSTDEIMALTREE